MKNLKKKSIVFLAGCALVGGLLFYGPKEGTCLIEGMNSGVTPPLEELKIDDYKPLKVDNYKKITKQKETDPKPIYENDINYIPEPCAGCPGLVPGY